MNARKMVRLGELGGRGKDSFAAGPFGSSVSSKNFTDSGLPMIRGTNLSSDPEVELDESSLVFLPDGFADRFPRSMVGPGDLVFTCWGTIGQVGLIGESSTYPRYLISNKQMKATLDKNVVNPVYAYYYLSQPSVNAEILDQAIGSSVPGFNLGQLKNLEIALPSFATQSGIAAVLGALDGKIGANRNVSKSTLALGDSLVRGASSNPTALIDVAEVVMGSSPKGELLNEVGAGMPFYQGVRDFGHLFPRLRVSTASPVRIAPAGATLFAVRAPVGSVNLSIEEVCIGRGLAAISSGGRPATLHFCLREFQEIWDEHQGGGTVFASVNGSDVRNVRLPIPEDPGGYLERSLAIFLERAVQAEKESIRLAATRDELLPLLMSGKITVKDAEKAVEEVV